MTTIFDSISSLLLRYTTSVSLADYIKSIKVATSLWMKQSNDFPLFRGWSEGYAAFTYSFKEKDTIIFYIKNQQEHHRNENSTDELKRIFKEHGLDDNSTPERG